MTCPWRHALCGHRLTTSSETEQDQPQDIGIQALRAPMRDRRTENPRDQRNKFSTVWGDWFACVAIAVPDCCNICERVSAEVSAA